MHWEYQACMGSPPSPAMAPGMLLNCDRPHICPFLPPFCPFGACSDPNVVMASTGYTPLVWAALSGQTEMVGLLLEFGAVSVL